MANSRLRRTSTQKIFTFSCIYRNFPFYRQTKATRKLWAKISRWTFFRLFCKRSQFSLLNSVLFARVTHACVFFFAAACAESFNIQAWKNKSITKEKRILVALLSVLFYCCGTAEWKSAHNTQEVAGNVKILIRMFASSTSFCFLRVFALGTTLLVFLALNPSGLTHNAGA